MSQELGMDGKGRERCTVPGDTRSWGFILNITKTVLGDSQAGK